MKSIRSALILLCFFILCITCGCVNRSLDITSTSETPVEVFIDGKYKGKTPYSEKFVYYGTREVMLKGPSGSVTITDISLNRPWFEYFPIDLLSEFLVPASIESKFTFTIPLREEQKINFDKIEKRAAEFKGEFNKLRKSNADKQKNS